MRGTRCSAESDGAHAFLTWEWAFTWWRHFGSGDELHIVAVEDGGEVIALAPLLRMRTGMCGLGLDVYLPIGHENADYGGVLLGTHPEEAGHAILDHLEQLVVSSNAVVELIRLPGDCSLLPMLRERAASSSRLKLDGLGNVQCLYVDFGAVDDPRPTSHGWPSATTHRASTAGSGATTRRRSNTTSTGRSPTPCTSCSRCTSGAGRTRARRTAACSRRRATRAFAIEAVEALAAAGIAKLSFVVADGVPVVGSLGYEYGGIFSWHKFSFDPDYATYSPGHLIVMLLLQHSVDTGRHEFNFGRADESYKERWVNNRRSLATVMLRRPGVRGSVQRRLSARVLRKRELRNTSRDGGR